MAHHLQAFLSLLLALLGGTSFMHMVLADEGASYSESLYFTVVASTTIGFGGASAWLPRWHVA